MQHVINNTYNKINDIVNAREVILDYLNQHAKSIRKKEELVIKRSVN